LKTTRSFPAPTTTTTMSTLQARHRGHNIPEGVTTFNEIEYDREGGVFLNRTKLILLAIIVFLLTGFSAFLGRYTAERQFRQVNTIDRRRIHAVSRSQTVNVS